MKTLPDAIIAGMGGDSDSVVLVRIVPDASDTWAELLWATRDITVTGWEGGSASKSFAGDVLKEGRLGTIHQSVDIEEGGNIAKVSGLTFKVINPEYNGTDRFDQNFTDNLENRIVEFYLVFWTGSNPAWSDILLLHRFVVDDVHYDHDEYKIKVKDAGFKRHKVIPDLAIIEDDYARCPEGNLNKIAPLLFGSLYGGTLYLNTFQAVPVFNINKDKPEYMISQNKCDTIIDTHMYLFFEEVNRWVQFFGSSNFSETYGPPSKIAFPLGEVIKGNLYSQLEKQASRTNPTSLNFANAVDNSDSTGVTLTGGQKLFLFAPIPSQLSGIVNEGSNLILQAYVWSITGDGIILRYYNPEYNDGVGAYSTGETFTSPNGGQLLYEFGADKSAHGRYPDPEDPKYDKLRPWNVDEIAAYEWGLEVKAGATVELRNIYVLLQNLVLKGKFHVRPSRGIRRRTGLRNYIDRLENVEAYCASVHGAEFGAWIDQDSRDNGYNSGNLVQDGAFIIESILRDELDLVSSKIDYESFDDVGNDTDGDRKDWKFAKIINEAEDSINIIGQFCKQAGLIYFQNYENKEKVVALKKRTAGKTIDRTTIQQGIINVRFSHLNQIYNEFYLNYNKHPGNNNFAKTLFITASDHNLSSNTRSGTPNTFTGLCSDSQDKYLKTNRLTLDCDWIRDDATAELLIKWLAEWLCYRKYIVEFKTDGLDHIDLELGDQVKIDHMLLPTGVSNDDSFLLYDISDDLNNDRMKFRFMQVPDLLA